jgi:arylformamidase
MSRDIPVDPVLEAGYNVRLRRTDFSDVIRRWSKRSAVTRQTTDAILDCCYNTGEFDTLDIFRCGVEGAPLFVFIHGGYWQGGNKSIYSFVAEPFLQANVDVAVVGYELCPSTDLRTMVTKIQTAIAWIWRNATHLGISADRINLSGHSAGGHLTAMLLAKGWSGIATDLPVNLIKSAIPISGLYQLESIRQTTIADALSLDRKTATDFSPHFLTPANDAPILIVVGANETKEFHWQSDQFVSQWRNHGAAIAVHTEPEADHFDMIDRLADRNSGMFCRILEQLR